MSLPRTPGDSRIDVVGVNKWILGYALLQLLNGLACDSALDLGRSLGLMGLLKIVRLVRIIPPLIVL